MLSNLRISICLWLMLSAQLIPAAESDRGDDINCLQTVKSSLGDPQEALKSWNFNNGGETNICSFVGITCWHDDENRVLNMSLSGMGLVGEFPLAVSECESMTGLNLSNNTLSRSIPSNISRLIPYITSLDLSYNRFSGWIPENLANCTFLNKVKLNNNNLKGEIPFQIGYLKRIKTFDVSNNQLKGPVPNFVNNHVIGPGSYANNSRLCGRPLPPCK